LLHVPSSRLKRHKISYKQAGGYPTFHEEIPMKHQIRMLRYVVGTVAISCALALVGFAESTTSNLAMTAVRADHHQTAAMVADWTRAKDYTKEYLDAMPEDGYSFKPSPDIRSFAEQMLHLANATGVASTNKVNLEKTDAMKTKAAATKAVLDSYDFVINAVKGMDASKMGEAIKLFGQDTTRGGALAKGFEHQTHHRGQTTIYLRLKGVKPPPEKLF
jgi:uncharacterized damage-inducible protein DinB